MEFKDQHLESKNPWREVVGPQTYLPLNGEQKEKHKDKWYYAEVDKLRDHEDLKNLSIKGMYYNLDPQPWIGRWNVHDKESLPKIVVLSLNPGVDSKGRNFRHEDNDESYVQRGERYYKLMKEIYSGTKKTSDVLFDEDYIHYNTDYWIKRMWKLVCKVCEFSPVPKYNIKELINGQKKTEEIRKIKDTFDKILFLDLFPYHSHDAKALNIKIDKDKKKGFTPQFKSMEFTRELVKWLIKNKVTFIYTYGQRRWEMYVDGLETYDKCFCLENPQGTHFTENNFCTIKRKYSSLNPDKTVSEEIIDTLKNG